MKNKKNIDFNLIKVSKILGIDFFNGCITVRDLLEIMEVAEFNPWEKPLKGYQRAIDSSKITKIAERTIKSLKSTDDFEGFEIFVDAINLNIRSENAISYVKPLDSKNDRYGGFHKLTYISELGKGFLVDGQHRAKGVQRAVSILRDDKELEHLENLLNTYVNISLTLTEDIYKEAYIFYLINQHAKNVPPEGATRLMVEWWESKAVNFKNEITRNSSKITIDDIECAKIADRLSEDSKVWASRIKDYNEKGAGKVSVRAMSKMMKRLYIQVKAKLGEDGENKAGDLTYQLVESFWISINKIFPNMFDDVKGKKYGITKSSQAEVLMEVLRYIYLQQAKEWEGRGYKFGNIEDPSSWDKVLITLRTFTDENNALPPRKVKGADCWLVGSSGSMGKYTSAGAKIAIARSLASHIENELKITRNNPQSLIGG